MQTGILIHLYLPKNGIGSANANGSASAIASGLATASGSANASGSAEINYSKKWRWIKILELNFCFILQYFSIMDWVHHQMKSPSFRSNRLLVLLSIREKIFKKSVEHLGNHQLLVFAQPKYWWKENGENNLYK